MQVAHIHDFDTHAVVGGKDIQAFGIAQTAEFFTVLSSTLYSNKPLAMAREYLCNGWDAHIAANRQHIPVIVKITDSEFVIKDNGYGIPHALIHNVFCVYGNSTKANDGKQTGGFGLGSKAGFAYSDHFTVINCHQGTKVVHAISRGSALTQGTPDRREMVRVPTTEEGLEVKIPVKSKGDRNLFINLVKQIASFGEMNVILNGEQISTVPISENDNGLFLTRREIPNRNGQDIWVRYGNVIYPVPVHEAYHQAFHRVKQIVNEIPQNSYKASPWALILQADPNTISVTPSRESLSMTETTVATLKELIEDISAQLDAHRNPRYQAYFKEHLAEAISYFKANNKLHKALRSANAIKFYTLCEPSKQEGMDLYDLKALTRLIIANKPFLTEVGNINVDNAILAAMVEMKYRRSQDISRYLWARQQRHLKSSSTIMSKFFRKRVFQPLLKKIALHPVLKVKNMLVATSGSNSRGNLPTADLLLYKPDIEAMEELLEAVVIIAYSKSAMVEHYHDNQYGLGPNRYLYIAQRSKGHREAASNFFRNQGFHVIDFALETEIREEEEREHDKQYAPLDLPKAEPRKPDGLMALSNLVKTNGRFSRRGHLARVNQEADHPSTVHRIEEPEAIFKAHDLSGSDWNRKFFEFGDDHGTFIVNWLGDKVGIAVNQAQYEAHIKKGRKDGYDYLAEKLSHEILTSPRIRSYFELKRFTDEVGMAGLMVPINRLISIGNYSPRLKAAFDLPEDTTVREYEYICLYEHLLKKIGRYSHKPWEKMIEGIQEKLKVQSVNSSMDKLYQMVRKNPMFECLDLDKMEKELARINDKNPNPRLKAFIEVSILNALKLK